MVVVPADHLVAAPDILEQAGAPLWAIVDGASCPELPQLVDENGGICLYRASTPRDAPHAPWLIPVLPDAPMAEDLTALGNIQHWGIIFASDAGERKLHRHFRRFTMLWTDANEQAPVYFRFFDPRVLSDAIQALPVSDVAHLLAPVQQLWVPLSPLLGEWTGLSPLAEPELFRGKFLQLALPEEKVTERPRAFAVRCHAYREMERLHGMRNRRKLARDLAYRFPTAPEHVVMTCAELAPQKAASYGLVSVKHVGIYADAMMIFGPHFDRNEPEAAAILARHTPVSLTKAEALRTWSNDAWARKRERKHLSGSMA